MILDYVPHASGQLPMPHLWKESFFVLSSSKKESSVAEHVKTGACLKFFLSFHAPFVHLVRI